MTKADFAALPPIIQRKVSKLFVGILFNFRRKGIDGRRTP